MAINTRFVVTSDGHWGSSDGTDGYQAAHNEALSHIDTIHNERSIDFLVHNGDLVEDDETLHSDVITNYFDQLPTGVDWYPVFGNHDWCTETEWENHYGRSRDYTFEYGNYGFIVVRTGASRDYMDWQKADATFIENSIDGFSGKDGVFVFHHIPPWATDQNSDDVVTQYQRDLVKGVFLGHHHQYNDREIRDNVRYYYCCLIGDERLDSPRGFRVFDIME